MSKKYMRQNFKKERRLSLIEAFSYPENIPSGFDQYVALAGHGGSIHFTIGDLSFNVFADTSGWLPEMNQVHVFIRRESGDETKELFDRNPIIFKQSFDVNDSPIELHQTLEGMERLAAMSRGSAAVGFKRRAAHCGQTDYIPDI
jgi:hypothetical protein